MAYLQYFSIPVKGLKIGNHGFTFKVDEKFFEEIEYSEIQEGQLEVKLLAEKQESMLIIDMHIQGFVKLTCDRCLEKFDFSVQKQQKIYVKYGETYKEDTDEVIIIPKNMQELNISSLVYEYLILSLPIKRIHANDEAGNSLCNQEIISKINSLKPRGDEIDPRWEKLKKLRKNNQK